MLKKYSRSCPADGATYPAPTPYINLSPIIDNYNPQPSHQQRILKKGFLWGMERLLESIDNDVAGPAYVYAAGNVPALQDWQNSFSSWSANACYTSDIANRMSGVWVNNTKSPARDVFYAPTNTKEYTIATGSPFEIESKNYARAGVKRYFDYFHSFQIYGSRGTLVINNSESHDYTSSISFTYPGKEVLNSLTLTDYEIFVGFEHNFGDDLSSFSDGLSALSASWGTDIYISDCSYSIINVQRNTRPRVSGIDYSFAYQGPRGHISRKYQFTVQGASDVHTKTENLNYIWNINGRNYYSASPTVVRDGGPHAKRYPDTVTLTVSDGDLSTVTSMNIVW